MEYRMTLKAKPLALALAAGLFTTPVFAADMVNSYSEPPAYNGPTGTSSSWNGAYLGAHGGTTSRKLLPFSGGTGLNAGVQGGYNAEVGGAVVGGELDFSYLGDANVKGTGGSMRERHRLAAKAKVGMPMDQTLIYGTTGLAMTNYRDHGSVEGPDGWKPGFIVGAGVEQKLTDNISAKVEYNYTITNGVRSTNGGVSSKKDVHDNTIEAGLNYHF
jgi:outer membrane immunogenic protein